MIRIASRAALAAASTFAIASPALAHMTFETAQSAPGEQFRGVLVLPHGCDGAPTDTIRVTLPQGFVDVSAEAKDGWTLETPGSDGQVSQIVWSGGSVPDDLPETDVLFAVEQMCGEVSLGWEPAVSLGDEPVSHGQDGSDAITVGDLELTGAFTRATLPNAPVGGGYVTITNKGDEADRLVSAQSSFSPDVQIHEMAVVNDVMQMQQLPEGLEIPAGETVTLAPGGLHMMFMNISAPFVEGETVPVTLVFEKAGEVEIELAVQAFGASGMNTSGHEGH